MFRGEKCEWTITAITVPPENSPQTDMLAQPTRAVVSLEREFQSELEEARAGANTGYLAEG